AARGAGLRRRGARLVPARPGRAGGWFRARGGRRLPRAGAPLPHEPAARRRAPGAGGGAALAAPPGRGAAHRRGRARARERARAQKPAPARAVEAKMRLALLAAERTPERTVEALADLAATPAAHALRAVVLGEAAEVAARAGRFEQALALLGRAAALGADG